MVPITNFLFILLVVSSGHLFLIIPPYLPMEKAL